VVRDLGVLLDSELTLKQHISEVASCCYYHSRRLRQFNRFVSHDIMIQLTSAFILSRLNHCNSILAGLTKSSIATLQRVQNAVAHLVLGQVPRDHISDELHQLHMASSCGPYKVQVVSPNAMAWPMTHTGRCATYLGRCATYLGDVLHLLSSSSGRSGLRSAQYVKLKLRTVFLVNAIFQSLDLRHGTIYLVTFTMLRLWTRSKDSLRPTCSMPSDNYQNTSLNIIFVWSDYFAPVKMFL